MVAAKKNLSILMAEAMRKNRPFRKVALYDCLAYNEGKCEALNELCCDREDCPFYKWDKGEAR